MNGGVRSEFLERHRARDVREAQHRAVWAALKPSCRRSPGMAVTHATEFARYSWGAGRTGRRSHLAHLNVAVVFAWHPEAEKPMLATRTVCGAIFCAPVLHTETMGRPVCERCVTLGGGS